MKEKNLAQSFQRWLLLLVLVAFLLTTAFLWVSQTKLSEQNAIEVLMLNMRDVKQDIVDASNENLLKLARSVAGQVGQSEEIDFDELTRIRNDHVISEINVIDENGFITHSTNPDFIGFDMRSGQQSEEFLVLLEGAEEYVQSYRPISYDSSISFKYAGVALSDGGFVQVGYDAAQFHGDISELVEGVTRNRHVGEGGYIILADESGQIVSDRMGHEGERLENISSGTDVTQMQEGIPFTMDVYGQLCYCIYVKAEGFSAVAVLPRSEVDMSRNVSVMITMAMQVVVFAALFVLIYVLIKILVVNNIRRINSALSQITKGDLDVVVDVRSHREFSSLSDDINSTVDTLKRYIDEAAARIDEELALAKTIQHASMPSVYPKRKEFDLFATMYTAKEVGGDFYDFFPVDQDTMVFLVSDVSGKGIPAAMFMMTAKTMLKNLTESGLSADKVFFEANEQLCVANDTGMFLTSWMGLLNTKTGHVWFVNAGHNLPLIKHGDGSFEFLKNTPSFVIGGMEGVRYPLQQLQLEPGDVIYLYTDGVTDATNDQDEMYGNDRLLELVNRYDGWDARTLCEQVKKDVDRFVGDVEQFDDITMLCLKYLGGEASE